MTEKAIETRIREHYVSENGEWLVEKGKVKEARLLKEACEALEKLRRVCRASERNYYQLLADINKREQAIEVREKAVAEGEKRLRDRIESVIKGMQCQLDNLK